MDKVWIRSFVKENLSCSLQGGHTQGMGQHTIFSAHAGRHINHSVQSNFPAVHCKGSNLPAVQSMLIAASSINIRMHPSNSCGCFAAHCLLRSMRLWRQNVVSTGNCIPIRSYFKNLPVLPSIFLIVSSSVFSTSLCHFSNLPLWALRDHLADGRHYITHCLIHERPLPACQLVWEAMATLLPDGQYMLEANGSLSHLC